MINDICLCQPEFQAQERLRVCWSFICSHVNIGGCSFSKQLPFAFSQRFLEQQEFAGKSPAWKQLHRAKQHRPPVLPFGNVLIAPHGVESAAAAQLQAQLQLLQRHITGSGSASAGTRYRIATFDVIPAGPSSDVCPEQRLRTASPENRHVVQRRNRLYRGTGHRSKPVQHPQDLAFGV